MKRTRDIDEEERDKNKRQRIEGEEKVKEEEEVREEEDRTKADNRVKDSKLPTNEKTRLRQALSDKKVVQAICKEEDPSDRILLLILERKGSIMF